MNKNITFQISEAAYQCGLQSDEILQFINHNWIQPFDETNLILDQDDLNRLQLIADLRIQMGVSDESVPIILHLIDQLNYLHFQLSR